MSPAISHEQRPRLRIIRGNPTDAEVAALVVALAAMQRRKSAAAAAVGGAEPAAPASGWAERAAQLRPSVYPGPDAWRRFAWPS